MNIWGLFFSFFLPGFVIGMGAMACIYAAIKRQKGRRA